MRSEDEGARVLVFRGCRLEIDSGDLIGPEGEKARLAPQPTRLLALLVAERGRLVTREAIAEELWPHGAVEIDQGIGYAMREVRKALEAVGSDPAAIETIPRRGFRLHDVDTVADRTQDAPRPSAPPEGAERDPHGEGRGGSGAAPRLAWFALGAVALAAVLAVLSLTRAPAAAPVVVIFEHVTSGDGPVVDAAGSLATTLTTRLTEEYGGTLGVVGPTGTSSLSGPDDTEAARARLGACLVVSGSVRGDGGGSAIVFTQIVRTADRVHVWASTDTVSVEAALDGLVAEIVPAVAESAEGCSG